MHFGQSFRGRNTALAQVRSSHTKIHQTHSVCGQFPDTDLVVNFTLFPSPVKPPAHTWASRPVQPRWSEPPSPQHHQGDTVGGVLGDNSRIETFWLFFFFW